MADQVKRKKRPAHHRYLPRTVSVADTDFFGNPQTVTYYRGWVDVLAYPHLEEYCIKRKG